MSQTFTILWDNDGVLVDTEGLYFRATQTVLKAVGIHLTPEQFKEISLRRGESTFRLAAETGIGADEIAHLRGERDRIYAEALAAESCVIDGAEEVLCSLHGRVRMGVVGAVRLASMTSPREVQRGHPKYAIVTLKPRISSFRKPIR